MRQHRVQNGDRIQAIYVQVNSMDYPAVVWVVIAVDGLVACIADPPIGGTIPPGPCPIYGMPQAASSEA